ncbi:ATP-dependent DNA helicase Snf21 [Stygiomarasmius scandens]|uniref:ATP-dependent DNA helicase Snf21 n=1 Tax=Marasmiellus scandens TaxID=2682957 RepID=A0ABR1IIN6_9AGAR
MPRPSLPKEDRFIRVRQRIRELEAIASTVDDSGLETGIDVDDATEDSNPQNLFSSTSHSKLKKPSSSSSNYISLRSDAISLVTERLTHRKHDIWSTRYYAVVHRMSEKITRQPSILVGGTLKESQLKGLQWMVSLYNKLNGSRKTIQTISLVSFLIEAKRQCGPYLVIIPPSTMTNWSDEFTKWAPSIKMIAYKGNPAQCRAFQGEHRVGNFQVLPLTTYEYIIKDRPHLSEFKH